MAGKTLDLDNLVSKDQLGCQIANKWLEWNTFRQTKVQSWEELRRYLYATDTTTTSNSKLPWNNKTTIPKICQIYDNLYANYMATIFPKRRNILWEGSRQEDETKEKSDAIRDYMTWVTEQPYFKEEFKKLVYDYLFYGNTIAMPDWKDERVENGDTVQTGYVGPVPRCISPLDIVFNPIAASFTESPKIIRSIVTLGEAFEMINRLSVSEEDRTIANELINYMKELRHNSTSWAGNVKVKDAYLNVDGFDSYQAYLQSNYVEVLSFFGDLYDHENNEFLRNHYIVVVDKHKVAFKGPHPSYFGRAPIYHSGWRKVQDNLWAMGPLDNLVGMQYRIDHVENMKADLYDLTAFPPLKIKGYVEDFEWGPMERIYCGDEGDVELLTPQMQVLQANIEISQIEAKMEEMAGAPKEAMGFRTPGEKTMYEVQRLENAASRIFQNKIAQFEEEILEPLLNGMLELARRNMETTVVRIINDEYKIAVFKSLTIQDITGSGRIRPVAARHFAERAEMVQNLTNFYASAIGQDPAVNVHLSGVKTAKMMEDLLEIDDYELFQPYIRLTEQKDAQRMANANQEDILNEAMTPAGIAQGDTGGIPNG